MAEILERRRRVLAWQLRLGDEIETPGGSARIQSLNLTELDNIVDVGVRMEGSEYEILLFDPSEPVTVIRSHGEKWGVAAP